MFKSPLGHICNSLTCGYLLAGMGWRATPQVTAMGVQVPLGHMLTYMPLPMRDLLATVTIAEVA